jgi:hypothetical protein
MGSYTIDSHNVRRYVTPEGYVQNEGDIGVPCPRPYEIAYGALTPKKQECVNLLVPVCVSSSHIAYGSIRMEPVFMILGQSAATAAAMAIDLGAAVQDVPYARLRERLLSDGQVLEYGPPKPKGIMVDDARAKLAGEWTPSRAREPFVGEGYLHDGNAGKGDRRARFEAALPRPGRYEVQVAYTPHPNRASRVVVVVEHAGGRAEAALDQRAKPPIEGLFAPVGVFEFGASAAVEISNAETDGYVVVDAIRLVER